MINKSKDRERVIGFIETIQLALLVIYFFFVYNAQSTLLPTFLTSISLYAFLGCTAFVLILKAKLKIIKYTVWWFTLTVLSIIAFLWAEKQEFSSWYNMLIILLLTFCVIQAIRKFEQIDLIMTTFVVSADVMGILLIATGQLYFGMEERLGQSTTGNANIFSALIMVAAVAACWLMVYHRSVVLRIFSLVSFVFCFVMLMMSGGRKTIVAVAVCLIWFVLAKDSKKAIKLLRNLVIIAAVICAMIYAMMNIPVFYNAIGIRFEELFKMISGDGSALGSDNIRREMIIIGIDRWLERPILGYGINTFKYYNKIKTGNFFYSHNNYVEMLYSLGLVGFVVYYYYIVDLIVKLFKIPGEYRKYKMLGIGLMLEILVYDFGGISFYGTFIQIVLAIIAIVVSICPQSLKAPAISEKMGLDA